MTALFAIAVFACMAACSVHAETISGTCGKNGANVTWSFDTANGLLKIAGQGEMADYAGLFSNTTPWNDYLDAVKSVSVSQGVTGIGAFTFSCSKNMTSVHLPNSIKRIGRGAFSSCDSLSSIVLPAGLETIENGAFGYCKALTSISIPESVTSIGASAFMSCDKLLTINIPSKVANIGYGVFTSCKSLTEINVDERNLYYSNDKYGVLFNKNKTELICFPAKKHYERYAIPGSVQVLAEFALAGCENLMSVSIPSSVTQIGRYAFADCTSLSSITLPDGVVTIGEAAFTGCDCLLSVNLPETVTTIGREAFCGCRSLESISLPNGITGIMDDTFTGCESLQWIGIPESVEEMGYDVFNGCTSLKSIYYAGTKQKWNTIDTEGAFWGVKNFTLYCDGSNTPFINGATAQNSYLYKTQTFPAANGFEQSSDLALNIYFNDSVVSGNGNLVIYKAETGEQYRAFDIGECNISDHMLSTPKVTFDKECAYYVLITPGLVYTPFGVPFCGITDKNEWAFYIQDSSHVKKTKYVPIEYPKKGMLFWKKNDTSQPPIPGGKNSHYAAELKDWANKYGFSSIVNESNEEKILQMPVKIPVTDTNGQLFLLDDRATTVKQVMQDLIFIEHFQTYAGTIDDTLQTASNTQGRLKVSDMQAAYESAEKYSAQVSRYLKQREGKNASNFFFSSIAPLAYAGLIQTSWNSEESVVGKFTRQLATVYIDESCFQESLKTLQKTYDYETFQQRSNEIKSAISIGKELYKVSTSGVSSSTVKLGANLFGSFLNDNTENKTLLMLADTWKDLKKSTTAVKNCMFLGSSLGMFPYVVELNDKLVKKVSESIKAWYFIADYYIQPRYPDFYDFLFDDGFMLREFTNTSHGVVNSVDWEFVVGNPSSQAYSDYNRAKEDPIVAGWIRALETSGSIGQLYRNDIVSVRRDITNVANFVNFASSMNIEDAKYRLLTYISAEMNRSSTVEAYGMCPIRVDVYDMQDNLLATLSSEDKSPSTDEYGSFYLLGEDNDTKYFILASDQYKMQIRPYDSGTMDVAIVKKDKEGIIQSTSYYQDVKISGEMSFLSDLSQENPSLALSDGDTLAELEKDAVPLESITIVPPVSDRMAVGTCHTFTASFYPEYSQSVPISWSVDNIEIADISEDGTLTLYAPGTVTITASTEDGTFLDSLAIEAFIPVTGIKSAILEYTMMTGEVIAPDIQIYPSNATNPTIVWETSNADVVSVDESGCLAAQKPGVANITATIDDVSFLIPVTVSKNPLNTTVYQTNADRDEICIDFQNMSCKNVLDGKVIVAIYHSHRLFETEIVDLKLDPMEKGSHVFALSELCGQMDAKVFLFDNAWDPLQEPEALPLVAVQGSEE